MPDTAPSIGFLKKKNVAPISKEDRAAYDAAVRAQQESDPLWKKLGRNAVSATSGAMQGFLGIDPNESERQTDPWSYHTNMGTQLLQAGLPFLAMTKGLPALHGTKAVFNEIDPALADTNDLLGHMFHAAGPASHDYANSYSLGSMKSNSRAFLDPKPNTLAVVPEAKNVLDLHGEHINPDDLSQAVASIQDPYARKALKETWKRGIRGEDINHFTNATRHPTDPNSAFMSSLQYHLDNPETANRMPFDAIRYSDIGHEVYAIPHKTQINTPWGTPLNNPGKPLKVTRLPDNAKIGQSAVTPHFQERDVMPPIHLDNSNKEMLDNLVNNTVAGDWTVKSPAGKTQKLSDWLGGQKSEAAHKTTLKDYFENPADWQGYQFKPPTSTPPKKTISQMITGKPPTYEHVGTDPVTGKPKYKMNVPKSSGVDTGAGESIIQKAADSTSGKLPASGGGGRPPGIPPDWVDKGFGKWGPKPTEPPHISPYDQGKDFQPEPGYKPGDMAKFHEPPPGYVDKGFGRFAPPGEKQNPHISPYDQGEANQPPPGYHPGVDMSDWDVVTPSGQKLKVSDYGKTKDMHDFVTQGILHQNHPQNKQLWEGYKLVNPQMQPGTGADAPFKPYYDDGSNSSF